MLRTILGAVLLSLLASGSSAQAPARAPASNAARPYSDVGYWKPRLEDPERRNWQRPGALLQFLGVSEGESVADLGAGTGYFTRLLSEMVGPAGRVFAVDSEPAMIKLLEAEAERVRFRNVTPLLAAPDDPRLPDGQVDLVLVVNTWHHIARRDAYIARLGRCLRGSKRVAIVDWHAGELPVGPPPSAKLAKATVIEEFRKAGWTLSSESVVLPYQYVLVFVPPAG